MHSLTVVSNSRLCIRHEAQAAFLYIFSILPTTSPSPHRDSPTNATLTFPSSKVLRTSWAHNAQPVFRIFFVVVQWLSFVWLFATTWSAAHQASLHRLLELAQIHHIYWVNDTIQPSHPLSPPYPPVFNFSSIRVFSKESALCIRWPKYWNFSFGISPSNDYSGLISFRMDWLDLLAVQGTQESSPTPQFKSISSLALSFLYSPTLTSIHDYWKNHSFD